MSINVLQSKCPIPKARIFNHGKLCIPKNKNTDKIKLVGIDADGLNKINYRIKPQFRLSTEDYGEFLRTEQRLPHSWKGSEKAIGHPKEKYLFP